MPTSAMSITGIGTDLTATQLRFEISARRFHSLRQAPRMKATNLSMSYSPDATGCTELVSAWLGAGVEATHPDLEESCSDRPAASTVILDTSNGIICLVASGFMPQFADAQRDTLTTTGSGASAILASQFLKLPRC
jgi:hypothetical protein